MRGKPVFRLTVCISFRITPADAGKTLDKTQTSCAIWDHPRGCGENFRERMICASSQGSPPRMRGKLNSRVTVSSYPRITPADAGKTNHKGRRDLRDRDHPRGCGENKNDPEEVALKKGSPPRMRGKQNITLVYNNDKRITPADAGKTCLTAPKRTKRWDHPRGCGENEYKKIYNISDMGSPPRMRGKPMHPAVVNASTGITPADAGKTNHTSLPHLGHWDHPRGCGENQFARLQILCHPGSPPQVRGKRGHSDRPAQSRGITPAGAGKTSETASMP